MQEIPDYLKPYIVQQDPTFYTPIDHAVWRYILRVSRAYFARTAHPRYLDGLRETGISTERIPLIAEIDSCLRKFGWRAVAVSGFIPPAAFMEFQSLGILPIACDMRKLENLAYTPAPDIVHEAAGHAPFLADPEYAAYLRKYGEISRKAIYSDHDMRIYEAIRNLSDIKENAASTPEDIAHAQKRLDDATHAADHVSEAAYLARMNWWTVEYGLVGNLQHPRIYGAGLLSSVRESYHCLGPEVEKLPFSLDCIHMPYDITRPQPQLFVTPDFRTLTRVLEEFVQSAAFRVGGIPALDKALKAREVTTTILDSGIQIGGKLVELLTDQQGNPCFLRYEGPVQLACQDHEIEGQGTDHHARGYSTPLGKLESTGKSPADLCQKDFARFGFRAGHAGQLRFQSGIVLKGILSNAIIHKGHKLLLSFENCTVSWGDRILFNPEWGTFDLACGQKVVSVTGGAGDRARYLAHLSRQNVGKQQLPGRQKSNLTEQNGELNSLYALVRSIRESATPSLPQLTRVHELLDERYRDDWLLRLELLELVQIARFRPTWESSLRYRLNQLSGHSEEKARLIARGLALLDAASGEFAA